MSEMSATAVDVTPPPLPRDRRIRTRYRVLDRIAASETSELWSALVLGPGSFTRRVVLKRARGGSAHGPEVTAAFRREAQVLSQLHHANVVSVLDFGLEATSGEPYLVLEHVAGRDVSALVQASPRGHVPPALALHIAREVASALAYVHTAVGRDRRPLGVVHRDVGPRNVMVSWAGDVRLTDFGIARWHDAEKSLVGTAPGTLDFMAPEQLMGGYVDARTDLFGLGALLHYMLTGRSPTEGVPRAERVSGGRTIDRRLAAPLAAIVARATARTRAERYPDARAMAEELWQAQLAVAPSVDARTALLAWLDTVRTVLREPDETTSPGAPTRGPTSRARGGRDDDETVIDRGA